MPNNDPMAILKQDHRELKLTLKHLRESKPGKARNALVARAASSLALHMEIEEQLVYPLVGSMIGKESLEEADIEHGLAREGMKKLEELADLPGFGAAVEMLAAGINHHVREEEHEILPTLKRDLDKDAWARLGDEVAALHKRGATSAKRRTASNGSIAAANRKPASAGNSR